MLGSKIPFQGGCLWRTMSSVAKRQLHMSAGQEFPGKIAVVGAGSFGSAMTRMVAKAIQEQQSNVSPGSIGTTLSWYARRQSVADEINTARTNAQYFPKGSFPSFVEATTDIHKCVQDARVVVIAVPAAYLPQTLKSIKEKASLNDGTILVSVLKSLKYSQDQQKLTTCSEQIKKHIPGHAVTALSGPNLYAEMASDDEFAEATIGYTKGDESAAKTVQQITSSSCFRTSMTSDLVGLELCGGLKNVISLAAGYVEGLGLGWNARSAVIRAGMHETTRLMKHFGIGDSRTMFEASCGVGDLVLTCTAGRGRQVAAAFVKQAQQDGLCSGKEDSISRWEELENSMLNGMKLPDWHNAQYVHYALTDKNIVEHFPLFAAVYQIGFEGKHPRIIIEALSKSIQASDAQRNNR